MLEKKVALLKVLELTQAATGNTDAGLDVPNPSAAVMATELYNSRAIAFARDEYLLVPDVPKHTLSTILRGQVEEIAGWAMYQQDNFPAAVIRLRRAVSVLPPNSAWWRSSLWRLGAAQEASGLDKEALSSYVESFRADKPDYAKYVILEALYKKINGSTEGLDALLGQPNTTAAQPSPAPQRNAAAPAAETKAEVFKEPAQPPARFPRAVPVALESRKTEIAPADVKPENAVSEAPEKAEAAAVTENTEVTGATSQPTAQATPVEAGSAASTDAEHQNGKENIVEIAAKPTEIESEAKAETKAEPAAISTGEPAKVEEDKAVKAEEAKTETAPPVSAEPIVTTEPAPTEEKKVETTPTMVETPAAVAAPSRNEEKKVELPPAEIKKEEVSTPPIGIKPDQPPPPTTGEEPENPHVPPVEVTRQEPPSPPGSAERTEVKISPASIVKNEDNPPHARLKVETTSNLPLDGPPRVITAKKPAPKSPPDTARQTANKSLFEPIIITVPKRAEDSSLPSESNPPAGSVRARVVVSDSIGAKSKKACSITTSKEDISVLRNDGGVGLLVGLEGTGDVDSIAAVSSSPEDVEVVPDEVGGTGDRRFYVVRSISDKRGVFGIKFEAACGNREIAVTVR
jgi:hypothetical protein